MGERKTTTYETVSDAGGNRYKFFCNLSGALVCTTKDTYKADNPKKELQMAWEKEGKKHFNLCRRCGKFVIDVMFNPEVCECVECAPYEAEPKYCKTCGAKIEKPGRTCQFCGNPLVYEGGIA